MRSAPGMHDRAVAQRVRRDRREHDGVHGGKENGTAGREVVGGRAGRRRDDQAVGPVADGVAAADRDGQIHDAAHRRLGDDHVVQRAVLPDRLAAPDQARGQQHPFFRSPCGRPGPPRAPGSISSSVVAVRNPSPPRLTPRIGTPRSPMARAMDSSVPSPPSTTRRSTSPGSSSLLAACTVRRGNQPGGLLFQDGGEPVRPQPLQDLQDDAAGQPGRRAWRSARRGSRKRLHHTLLDEGLEIRRGPAVGGQMQEELAVALGPPQGRGGHAEDVPAAQHGVAGQPLDDRPVREPGRGRPRPCRRARAPPRTAASPAPRSRSAAPARRRQPAAPSRAR